MFRVIPCGKRNPSHSIKRERNGNVCVDAVEMIVEYVKHFRAKISIILDMYIAPFNRLKPTLSLTILAAFAVVRVQDVEKIHRALPLPPGVGGIPKFPSDSFQMNLNP